MYEELKAQGRIVEMEKACNLKLTTATGIVKHENLKAFKARLTMNGSDRYIEEMFTVLPSLVSDSVILGMSFLRKADAVIRAYNGSVTFNYYKNNTTGLPTKVWYNNNTQAAKLNLMATESVTIRPGEKIAIAVSEPWTV